jgi:uncharacterized repeat protein (TIGR02543 family)
MKFNVNGGSGTVASQVVKYGDKVKKPASPSRSGYTFKNWNTRRNGLGQTWNFATMNMPARDVTLYAQWTKNETTPTPPGGGTPNPPPQPPGGGTADTPNPPAAITPEIEQSVQPPDDEAYEGAIPPAVEPEASGFSQSDEAKIEAQTGNPLIDIIRGDVPLGSTGSFETWGLLNLLRGIAAVALSALMIMLTLLRRRREEDDGDVRANRMSVVKVGAALAGLITLIAELILDDFDLPVSWFNRWTILIGALFMVHIILLIVGALRGRAGGDGDNSKGSWQEAREEI